MRKVGPVAWRLGLAVLFVGLVASYVEIPAVIAHLTSATVWGAAAMQPILALGIALTAARLSVLAGGVAFTHTIRAVILCYGLNVIIPGRLSELVKIAYLREHGKLSTSASLAAVVLERALDTLMLGVVALLAAALLLANVSMLLVAAMVATALGLVSLPLWSAALVRVIRRLPWRSVGPLMEQFVSQAAERVRSRSIWIALGISVCIWTLSAVGVYVFLQVSLGDRIGAAQALLVLAAVITGASIPGFPGGFGTYEAGGVLALRFLGFGVDEALAIALALHAGHIVLTVLLTVLLLMAKRTGVGSLLRSAMEVLQKK